MYLGFGISWCCDVQCESVGYKWEEKETVVRLYSCDSLLLAWFASKPHSCWRSTSILHAACSAKIFFFSSIREII